ncbi:hypothetical protein FQN49_001703 [Arthroderma sp. PD_2]|nr:hypothetical protein FQN49_001703 [Arthroderma sp. PD_2]
MISLAHKLFPKYKSDCSTTRIQNLVNTLTNDKLRAEGVPSKYWADIRRLPSHVANRNSAAHQTPRSFAKLILRPGMEDMQAKWSELFAYAYNKPVQEMVD